ncbi:MAG: NAD(P)-dependent oxidoreductase [Bacteroidales bacterium]|nr:NAD(P)-dependent oxidoreductase [Bacteroidales bacterium]
MENVIIIGSSGFLGNAVTRELILAGYHVYATENRKPVRPGAGLTIIQGGIKSLTSGKLDQTGAVAIFHCARPTMPRLRYFGRIIAGMQAKRYNRFLLSQIEASSAKPALVYASGSLVYGNSALPHHEESPLHPISYARQYHHGEDPVLQAINVKKTKALLLRFPWLLGNGSWFSWFYLKPLREHNRVPLFGDGTNRMSLLGVADAARLMVQYYKADQKSGVYNIFSPHVITQKSFAETVASHFGGTVDGCTNLFPRRLEKAVMEAFTSNILLQTKYPEILDNHEFQTVEQILDEIPL